MTAPGNRTKNSQKVYNNKSSVLLSSRWGTVMTHIVKHVAHSGISASQSAARTKTNASFLSLLHLLKLEAFVDVTVDTFPGLVTTPPCQALAPPQPPRLQCFCSFHVHDNKMSLTLSLFFYSPFTPLRFPPTLPHFPALFFTLIHHSVMLQFTRFQSVSGGNAGNAHASGAGAGPAMWESEWRQTPPKEKEEQKYE